jgi:hypothetical protein|tara:strand:- start:483 stop:770 length:288 start_codon:yes stop_codon:yes gene_type:complete
MAYGFRMWGSDGNLEYDSDSVTWNQVDFYSVAAGSSDTRTFSSLSGKEVKVGLFFINPPLLTRKATSHTATVTNNNTTISISGGSEAMYILVLMR